MSAASQFPTLMLVRDFLTWDFGDGLRYELVDGEARGMAPPSTVHGFLQNEMGSLIRNHLREHSGKRKVIANPGVIPHLLSAYNVRAPDLGVTCSPVIPGQTTLPDPILLIEILSPGNEAKTWSNVWTYTSIPSVREILVLHSSRITAELLRRIPQGAWAEEPVQVTSGELMLTSIDFRVALADLYDGTGLTT